MKRLLARSYGFSSQQTKYSWQPGDRLSKFVVVSSRHHADFDCHLHHLVHEPTQSHFYHIERPDTNNCFAPIVQTLASNDKGAPHILEHLACCGSQKFPVRDPFFNMLKRSLSTYMNAWTGQDFTCYPFSTANSKDYDNLLRVYLDMVFRPKLSYLDFRQEGWRHEVENQLVKHKGVVLNEMLGAYQSPDRKLLMELARNLLSGTPYSYDTGGYPKDILELSYGELLQMHRDFYRPSNVQFFAYGDRDIRQEVLPYLERQYLATSGTGKSTLHSFKPKLLERESTIRVKLPESQIILGYYLGELDKLPREDVNALSLLSYLLFETNQAPLYEQLMESGLGDTYTNQYGLAPGKLLTFSFGVKKQEGKLDHHQLRSVVEAALRKICGTGFSAERVDEVVHQTRISTAMPSKNNGLRLLQKLMTPINHGCDIHAELNFKSDLEQLQAKLKSRHYVAQLIDKYLLGNRHSCSVLLESDMGLEEPDVLPPAPLLESVDAGRIIKQQNELAARQNEPVKSEVLPCLDLSDVAENMAPYVVRKTRLSCGHTLHFVKTPSTGISHLRLVFRFSRSQLPEDLCKALDLWSYVIMKGVSTSVLGYKQLSKQMSLHCSDFRVSFDHTDSQTLVVFSLAALHENLPKAAELLGSIISQVRFERDCVGDLMKAYLSDSMNDLVENVMAYAKSAAVSGLSESEFRKNRSFLKQQGNHLAGSYLNDEATSPCIQRFERLHRLLVHCSGLEFVVHSSEEPSAGALEGLAAMNKPQALSACEPWQFSKSTTAVRHEMDIFNVDCLAKAYSGPEAYSQEAAHLAVFLELLEQKHLHKEIREKGGAYGTGAGQLPSSVICLSSYLDPDPQRSLRVMEESIDSLALKEEISEQELKEAKLSIFSCIDSPVVDYQVGLKQIMYGQTYELVNSWRRECLRTTAAQLKEAAKKWLVGQPSHSVAFGPPKPPKS